MTQSTTPDKLVSEVIDAFLKGFNAPTAEPQGEPKQEATEEIDNPVYEAIRILKELEGSAEEFDDDLRIAIVDRYIEIGRLINS